MSSGISGVLSITFLALLLYAPAEAAPPSFAINDALNALRQKTLARSPDLMAVEAVADQRGAALYSAWTRWLPRADLKLSQTRTQDYSLLTSGQLSSVFGTPGSPLGAFTPEELTLKAWNLMITMPLYKRSVHVGVQAAIHEARASKLHFALKQSEVDWKLRQLLGQYLLQLYKLATLKTSRDLAKTALKEAKLRFELGERTRVDVIRSEANLLSFDSKALTYEQERNSALSQLLEYTGVERGEFDSLFPPQALQAEDPLLAAVDGFSGISPLLKSMAPLIPNSPQDTVDLRALEDKLMHSSPVYQSIIAEEEAATAKARQLVAHEFPEFLVQASVNKQAPDWSTAFEPDLRSRSVALVVNIPLFSWGSTLSSYSEALNAQKGAALARDKSLIQLKESVENTALQIQALRQILAAQKLSVDRNLELVRLSQKTYQLGKTTLLELLTSQNDLTNAKLEVAQTKLNTAIAIRTFAWNLGIVLQ